MTEDLELLNVLYAKFCKNDELMGLLGNPKTPKERVARIHREITPLEYATEKNVNFISMYLSSATETDNIYVVRAFLNMDYYAASREELARMKRIVTEILRDMDIFCVSTYNVPSDTKGVYRYKQMFRPLIWS